MTAEMAHGDAVGVQNVRTAIDILALIQLSGGGKGDGRGGAKKQLQLI